MSFAFFFFSCLWVLGYFIARAKGDELIKEEDVLEPFPFFIFNHFTFFSIYQTYL